MDDIKRQDVEEFLRQYEAATNTHDFTNVAPLIHQDALYRFTDGDFAGIEAIQKAFEDTWARIQDETYSISDLKVVSIDSHSASVSYTFHWAGMVDGQSKSGTGRGTNVLVKNEKGLQCIYEHLSN